MDVLSTAILSDLRLSLASLIITTYWSTWVMIDVSYLHSLHSSESTHLYSQRPWQLYFLHPLGDDAVLLYTLLQRYLWTCVRSHRCPSGPRASPQLKRTGENTYFHFGIHSHLFHMSFFVYPSVTLSLSLCSLSLFLMCLCIIFLAWSPHTLSASIRISWCLLLCSYCLSFWHTGTNTHNTEDCLFTARLGDHPLAISGQALSHDAPQYTVGYRSHLIPSLIWLD